MSAKFSLEENVAKKAPKAGTIPAIERFFRKLDIHAQENTLDSLFDLLNALHSMNDKMNGEYRANLFDIPEFLIMKALRNYYQHQDEVGSEIRFFHHDEAPIISSLMTMCLIERTSLRKAVEAEDIKGDRDAKIEAMEKALSWYGAVVDINPCLFNLGVHVCMKVENLGIDDSLTDETFTEFYGGYVSDKNSGVNIFVDQGFSTSIGAMGKVLKDLFGIEAQGNRPDVELASGGKDEEK
ncbi:hypothetical protein [Herbaspirillum rubrisubalbicans]|uniref:hypothetical protein n=1 Tax=Herbaspirillum rubrisubalbicans TaxID=80842 RepID=UPI0015C579E1|nr:hypothetical protein [Herbaspirillum rubrisubalbicans]NQE51879.1 hypothetical protein [Herbaspirillum rubrisubalbicans]